MISLTDELIEFLVVGDIKYPINTDFRLWLDLANNQASIEDIFIAGVPLDAEGTLKAISEFISGEKESQNNEEQEYHREEKVIDFDIDAPYIYAGFLQSYNIDLFDIKHLHWHKFKALLKALPENTMLSQIIGYRRYKGDDKELLKLKEHWKLPVELTEAEKEAKAYFDEVWG